MKLDPIESTERLYVRVAKRIADFIEQGTAKVGDKLPSERDLAEMLKVSRPTVREAMIALEVSGVIEVRTGSGIYVAGKAGKPRHAPKDDGIGPFDLLEIRSIIEPEAAALAAERMTKPQVKALRAIVEEMAAMGETPELEALDEQFHMALARGTENAAILSAIEWLWRLRTQSGISRGYHRLLLEEGVFPVIEEHRRIVDAIESGSGSAARQAMLAHLAAATEAAAQHFKSEA